MTRTKRVAFGAIAMTIAATSAAGLLLVVDMRLHTKYQTSAGYNIWGYRGPAVGRKQPGEYRVVVIGGSSAYGYGVTWDQSAPALLERRLTAVAPAGQTFRVVNLAYNNEAAFSFTFTLQDYDSLNYDLVLLYEGYNDLQGDSGRPNTSVFRHDSPVFRLTGYLPIFPIIFKEKAAAMLSGGDPGALYKSDGKTVFRPTLATRTAAGVLRAAGEAGQSLEQQLGRVNPEPPREVPGGDSTGCHYPWRQYCRSVANAVELALSKNRQVLFATQPYEIVGNGIRARHMDQQREAAAMLERLYGRDRRVTYVNLGDVADLNDPKHSFDHMHLTAVGNALVAEHLVAPVLEMAARKVSSQ